MQSGLSQLDKAIKGADQVLGVAESSGMEVSEARLGQDQARDSLTKARVTIHSFRTDLVDQDIQAGLKIAAQESESWERKPWLSATIAVSGLEYLSSRSG